MTEILIVAYYFKPDKRVGAIRASYWYDELPNKARVNVSVITSEKDAKGSNIHVVPDDFIPQSVNLIKDPGYKWSAMVKRYVLNNSTFSTPDIVIITGGPFMHFSLGKWFKKTYGSKIILDYRDPFSINPLFNDPWYKKLIKRYYEWRFNRSADALITVNSYCAKLITGFNNKQNRIIDNGFDERFSDNVDPAVNRGGKMYIYAGKFYFDPVPLQLAIDDEGGTFTYLGDNEGLLDTRIASTQARGFLTYRDSVEEINSHDVGVIQLAGESGHLSTTKVFDYMRCGLRILIVSENPVGESSIRNILKAYPHVYYALNDQESIRKEIRVILKTPYVSPDKAYLDSYSRSAQLDKLVSLINELH